MNNFFKKHFFRPGWLQTWRPYFLFFLIIFIVYGQTLFFDLTYLDDNALILDRYEVIKNIGNIETIFSSDAFFSDNHNYYRPLLNLTYMIDSQFGPLNYAIYHISNLLWHFLAVSLLFLVFKRLFKKPSLAFFLALIFLVHPALSQAVAWLPGRNDSLVTAFILLSFWFFLDYTEKFKLKSFLAYLGFFFLALLSKETSVFFPLILLTYFYSIGREKKIAYTDQALIIFGSAAVGFIWVLMRSFALGAARISSESAFISILKNLPSSLVVGAKMILPFNLSVLPMAIDTSIIYALIAWPAVALIIIFSKRKNLQYLFFGLAWFIIFFLPPFAVSTIAPHLFEHRLYLPLIGFLIALFSLDDLRNLNFKNKKTLIISALILSLFVLITIWHSRSFRNPLIFWQTAVAKSPHSTLAHLNLGVIEYFNSDTVGAEKSYRQALSLNPLEPMVHNNLGVLYMGQHKYNEAQAEFMSELEINPGYDKAISNLNELKIRENNLLILKNPLR